MNTLISLMNVLADKVSTSSLNSARILSSISYSLFKYRIDHDLDQKEMAELLGVSQPMISKYESGTYNFTVKTLADISEKIGLQFDVVFKESPTSISNSRIQLSDTRNTGKNLSRSYYNGTEKVSMSEISNVA